MLAVLSGSTGRAGGEACQIQLSVNEKRPRSSDERGLSVQSHLFFWAGQRPAPRTVYFSRVSGKMAASSGMGTGGPCEACFSLVGAEYVGVAQPQLKGAEQDEQPHPQLQ